MPYLGSTPNASFSSRTKQDFTANGSTTAFTLSSAVASPNDIEVFVGNVRQEPTEAYTVNGVTLTMSAAPANGINFYVVFKGVEENSVVPADGTISDAKIATMAASKLTGALPAISGAALTNLGDNTPSFKVLATSGTNISNTTWTKVTMGTKIWDTDTAFDLSNSRFTVPAGKNGKYQFHFRVKMSGIDDNEYIRAHLYKNGTRVEASGNEFHSPGSDLQVPSQGFYAMSLVAGDYIELWCYHNEGGTRTMFGGTNEMQDASYLQVVRLIGV